MAAFLYPDHMLKKLTLLRDRVENWTTYPFNVPIINTLHELAFTSRVCFFTGENGSGKSTLLEAIAAHYGFGREGGTRNFRNDSTDSNHSVDELVRSLRLSFDVRRGTGFYLRAESLFNFANFIDQSDLESLNDPGEPLSVSYGGTSLQTHSHGETFLTVLDLKCRRNGLFLFDEPEAALSPQRQLSLLAMIFKTLQQFRDAQFIISTHSPVLLGYPGAQIVSFDHESLQNVCYDDTSPAQILRSFINHRESVLEELFRETPSLPFE